MEVKILSDNVTYYIDIILKGEEFNHNIRLKIPENEISRIFEAKEVSFRIQQRTEIVKEETIAGTTPNAPE